MKCTEIDIFKLMEVVPQTYGEAIVFYPWLKCESHEWDNRTTVENAVWLICQLNNLNKQTKYCEFPSIIWNESYTESICVYCGTKMGMKQR